MQTQILIGLFICHFLADFTPLSTPWMLNAKRLGKPVGPIFMHAVTHAALMAIALAFFVSPNTKLYAGLFLFQLATHFLIDVWKGRMNGWFPALQNPANKSHWAMFGFDQLLHAVVIITMAHYASI